MNFFSDKYFQELSKNISDFDNRITEFKKRSNKFDFDYMAGSSAVFSSNIEGNSVDLNSFMNHKLINSKAKKSKEISEIEDLIDAYNFAKNNNLTQDNFLKTHKLLSKNILIKSKQGRYRDEKVGVFDSFGLKYMAIEPELVEAEMNRFFKDINNLLITNLNPLQVFYYASFIHLRFAHIHPFMDGNGRAARLLEKWFLVSKLGIELWNLQSEKYYWENRADYYKNIDLGVNFYELDYDKSLPFLRMLVTSLR